MDAVSRTPVPANEPVRQYQPGSHERAVLESKIKELAGQRAELTMTIGGNQQMAAGQLVDVVQPHNKAHVLGQLGNATNVDVAAAIYAAKQAAPLWRALSFDDRAAIFLKAAELLAGPWRATLNASTMLGQSKSPFQAEIDAACELIDFWRYNVHFARRMLSEQPESAPGAWNRMEYRPLEGFVLAITPFNFTSIAANLPTAPALLGNVVVWKPSPTQQLSAHYIMRLLEAAGLPPGVINLVTGDGQAVSQVALTHPDLVGIHFTGSTATFQHLWRTVGENVARYRNYPRLVGETGGKDFVIVHPSADPAALAPTLIRGAFEYQGQKCSAASRDYIPESIWQTGGKDFVIVRPSADPAALAPTLIRGAFEYQGQKCSAASRAYIPESIWRRTRDDFIAQVESLTMGDVTADLSLFMGAVIDARAFGKHAAALERARSTASVNILAGGAVDDTDGFFVRPTVLEGSDPADEIFTTEYFGPILAVHVYPDADPSAYAQMLAQAADATPYALTGAIMATDRQAIAQATDVLRYSAGNFYINDKPTGAVVGQQPFGGARASGTDDKAGSIFNLTRWVSARAIKELFVPPTDYRYPYMG